MIQRIWRFLRDQDGPTTVEYSVMLMLIVLGCVVGSRLIGATSNSAFQETAEGINDVVGDDPLIKKTN